MKFRWRGGSRGYFVRGWARARRREYYRNQRHTSTSSGHSKHTGNWNRVDVPPLPFGVFLGIVTMAALPLGLIAVLLIVALYDAIRPILVVFGLAGTALIVYVTAPTIRELLSKFLFENNDGEVLTFREIGRRAIESVSNASWEEKGLFGLLAVIGVVIYATLIWLVLARLI